MNYLLPLGILLVAYVGLSLLVRAREKALGVAPAAEVRKAIWIGIAWINAPLLPIMLGPTAAYQELKPGGPAIIGGLLFLTGFVLAWAWWSVNVSLWRRWAARRGIDPEDLQTQGQSSSLLWPPGHFFERTEFDQLRKRAAARASRERPRER
jgi:hypothetical protein